MCNAVAVAAGGRQFLHLGSLPEHGFELIFLRRGAARIDCEILRCSDNVSAIVDCVGESVSAAEGAQCANHAVPGSKRHTRRMRDRKTTRIVAAEVLARRVGNVDLGLADDQPAVVDAVSLAVQARPAQIVDIAAAPNHRMRVVGICHHGSGNQAVVRQRVGLARRRADGAEVRHAIAGGRFGRLEKKAVSHAVDCAAARDVSVRVDAGKSCKRCARIVDRRELAVRQQIAVTDTSLIEITPHGIAPCVAAGDVGVGGVWIVDRNESAAARPDVAVKDVVEGIDAHYFTLWRNSQIACGTGSRVVDLRHLSTAEKKRAGDAVGQSVDSRNIASGVNAAEGRRNRTR